MNSTSYLVVDDDDAFRSRLARALRDRGYEAYEASNVEQGYELARKHQPKRIILDLRLPNTSGLELIEGLKDVCADADVLMLTGYGSIATAIEAMKNGACHYLTKPADLDEIINSFGSTEKVRIKAEGTPTLSRVEWEHIERVMADCGGNISKASKILGLHRRSLQRKLKSAPPRQ